MGHDDASATLFRNLRSALSSVERASPAALHGALSDILAHFGCVTGTIHRLDPATGLLQLVTQRGIPDTILDRVRTIPIGKGMAGIAAERREPVQVCNLQTDETGVAKPAARLTGMEGSIAVPMLVDGRLRGVLGVAKPQAYDFTTVERELLLRVAAEIGAAA